METLILEPVVVLVAWTLVILVWMMSTRLPYLTKNDILPQELQNASDVAVKLPARIRRVSDNYNHLHEQPTLFLCFSNRLSCNGDSGERSDSPSLGLCWIKGYPLDHTVYV